MTRSDLLLAVTHACNNPQIPEQVKALIWDMHFHIEQVYKIAFELQDDPIFKEVGELLQREIEK